MQPAAITLDLRLPDMDGWVVLDRLKHDPTTRHIPVHVISVDDSWQRGIRLGAFAFLKKPVSKRALHDAFSSLKGFVERGVRELLIVEDNDLESVEHHRRHWQRRRSCHGGRHGWPWLSRNCMSSNSTAWCST